MSTPSNTELQALIDGATPGPWFAEYVDGDPENVEEVVAYRTQGTLTYRTSITEYIDGTDDARLIALTPDIAAELITVRTDHDHLTADRDRLRDGIKALIDEWQEAAKRALHTADTVSDPYHDARARQRVKTFTDHANTLRALLDGEAKG